jgi:hypothetical protein
MSARSGRGAGEGGEIPQRSIGAMPAPVRKPSLVVDTHVRVAAWLHIALALITFGLVCVIALGLAAFSQWGASNQRLFFGIGGTVLLGLGIFPVIQFVGAAKLLAGKASGRIITLVFSVIYLLKFPVGTSICVYSFWVLLREQPKPARRTLSAGRQEPAPAVAPPSTATTELALAISARRSALAAARSRVAATADATTAPTAAGSPPRATHGGRLAAAAPGRPAAVAPGSAAAKTAASTLPRPRPGTSRPS